MADYYVYLISSLPMLHFAARPPFSFERFLEICADLIPDADMELLKASSITGEYDYQAGQPTLKEWRHFDTVLRNELVKIRAGRKHQDSLKYLRKDGYAEPYISHLAMNAYRSQSILEAERMLDQERWRMLEEQSFGHYFDIDFLLVYTHKLLILQRWEKIHRQNRPMILQEALAGN